MGLLRRKNRVAYRLDDRVHGREGTVVAIVPVNDPDDPTLQTDMIYFTRDTEIHRSWKNSLKHFLSSKTGMGLQKIGPIPREAWKKLDMTHPDPAVPDKKVVIHEDANGQAPYDERVRGQRSQIISELQAENERLRDKLSEKDIDIHEAQQAGGMQPSGPQQGPSPDAGGEPSFDDDLA